MHLNEKRILIVDDNTQIHNDFRKILERNSKMTLFEKTKSKVFPGTQNIQEEIALPSYKIDSAYQGQEAVNLVKASLNDQPYALAFIDIRMPPGWNGIETIKNIWNIDPNIQIVICTAYSDYSWEEMFTHLKNSDNFLILKKPFDAIEVIQLAASLTEKWELKQRVQQQIDTLEKTVLERTVALRLAKKVAENANDIKNEFLANISHELRTPLNCIIGFIQIMNESEVDPAESKMYFKKILLCSNQLLQMITDMLDVSQMEFGKMEFHPVPVDLHLLVNEIRSFYDPLIAEKNIKFDININPTLPTVVTDPAKLKQVFMHYVSNALKFTPNGGKVEIRIFPVDNGQFRIEIKDSGIGISKPDIKKLFLLFQQQDSSMSKKYGGIGIGLSLIKRIVELQGGKVGAESEPNKGSTFFAVLPYTPSSSVEQH